MSRLQRGTVGDDAMAAGGNVTLAPDARVGGRAWLSGARIDVAGTIDGALYLILLPAGFLTGPSIWLT